MPDFPSLNNDFDSIRLISRKKTYIDSLNYTSGWGGNHVSLERKSYNVPAFYSENWGNSSSPLMGTPGKPNLVKPGTTPPHPVAVHLLDGRHIEALFSSDLDKESAQNKNHYTFSPAANIDSVFSVYDTVNITLAENLDYNVSYKLRFHDINGLFGNTIKSVTDTLLYDPDITPPKISSAFFNDHDDSVFINCDENIGTVAGLKLSSSDLAIRNIQGKSG